MAADAQGRRRAALVLVLTFLAGAATGAGAWASFAPRRGPHHGGPFKGFGPGPHGGDPRRLPPPFEELELTPAQRAEAEAIFARHRPAFDAVFDASRPKLNALRDALDAELLPVLTDAQRARLAEWKARRPPLPSTPPPPPPPAP